MASLKDTTVTGTLSVTGIPTILTAAVGTNTTQAASTAFVNAEIANDAPSKTGTGASGTWGISISGAAAAVISTPNRTDATNYPVVWNTSGGTSQNYTCAAVTINSSVGSLNANDFYGRQHGYSVGNDFNGAGAEMLGNGSANTLFPSIGFHQPGLYAATLQLRSGTDFIFYQQGAVAVADVTARTFNGALNGNATTATKASTLSQGGGAGTGMTFNWSGQGGQPTWLWGGNDGSNHYIYNPSNFNVNQAVKLMNSSGDWVGSNAISNVVGQLSWKNYGNDHTIFDASNATAPNGAPINNTNSQFVWSAKYPTLMGWNGSSTYGVRVDSCRIADTVAAGVQTLHATDALRISGSTVSLYKGDGTSESVDLPAATVLPTAASSIGCFIIGRPKNPTNYVIGTTVAGTTLYNMSVGVHLEADSVTWASVISPVIATPVLVNIGSWRCVSPASASTSYPALAGLWVRYA